MFIFTCTHASTLFEDCNLNVLCNYSNPRYFYDLVTRIMDEFAQSTVKFWNCLKWNCNLLFIESQWCTLVLWLSWKFFEEFKKGCEFQYSKNSLVYCKCQRTSHYRDWWAWYTFCINVHLAEQTSTWLRCILLINGVLIQ